MAAAAAELDRVTASAPAPALPTQVTSPWSTNQLAAILWQDVFGDLAPTVSSREQAMALPPLARARNLVVSFMARTPLVELELDTPTPDQPAWLSQVPTTSPQLRMAWTADDLFFHGVSCWARLGDGSPGWRLRWDEWTFNEIGQVCDADGRPYSDDQVLTIFGYHEGVLAYGQTTLTDARLLYAMVRQRLANPIPNLELHQTGGEQLNDTEIDALVASWAAARQGANGGVAYTNELIQLIEHGGGTGAELMIDARNAMAVDLARVANVSAGMVDATAPKASLNYETQTGRNLEFQDLDVALYMDPITARLSLDDVTSPGRRVAFDTTQATTLTPAPTGPTLED